MKKNACFGTRCIIACLAIAMIVSLLLTCVTVVGAESDFRRAPYLFQIEKIDERGGFAASQALMIVPDHTLALHASLTVEGWLATDEGVAAYQYAWIPKGSIVPVWQTPSRQVISPRPDLSPAGIPYSGGHGTAGYRLEIPPAPDMADGYYDLYVRAVTGDGVICDLLVLTDVKYGVPNIDNGELLQISLPLLERTKDALREAEVRGEKLLLTNRSVVALGDINLTAFEGLSVTYSVDKVCGQEKTAVLGLKSSPDYPYGDGTGKYNLTDHLVALPLDTESPGALQTAVLNLEKYPSSYNGPLYLSAYLDHDVTLTVHEISFVYRGKGYDRTAAKIHFSSDLIHDFSGSNRVALSGISDAVMGEVLRVEVTEETNDPFVYFQASAVLARYDLRLNADDYKYMVVLARAGKDNPHPHMTFYLCAGTIYSATEACTYNHSLITDGKWHYYVFDLTQREHWKGNINGWRFDIINADCRPGNYVDFATIQFFRTPEAAAAAAAASVNACDSPYVTGSPAVERDPCEEASLNDSPMSFPDGEWYVEEKPIVTTPEESGESAPSWETQAQGGALVTESQEPPSADHGCRADTAYGPLLLITLLFVAWFVRKRKAFL